MIRTRRRGLPRRSLTSLSLILARPSPDHDKSRAGADQTKSTTSHRILRRPLPPLRVEHHPHDDAEDATGRAGAAVRNGQSAAPGRLLWGALPGSLRSVLPKSDRRRDRRLRGRRGARGSSPALGRGAAGGARTTFAGAAPPVGVRPKAALVLHVAGHLLRVHDEAGPPTPLPEKRDAAPVPRWSLLLGSQSLSQPHDRVDPGNDIRATGTGWCPD